MDERQKAEKLIEVKRDCESFSKTIGEHLKNKKPNDANATYQDFIRYWRKMQNDKEISYVLEKESKVLVSTNNDIRALFNKYKVKIV